jgi:hypothetical protein
MTKAVRLAMKIAMKSLSPAGICFNRLYDYSGFYSPHKGVENDTSVFQLPALRLWPRFSDHLMIELTEIPGHVFCPKQGYGTESHMSCLHKLGPSPCTGSHFSQ